MNSILDELYPSWMLAQAAHQQPQYQTRVARDTFDSGGYPISTDQGMSFDPQAVDAGGYPVSTQDFGSVPYQSSDPNVIYDQGGNPMSTEPGISNPNANAGGGFNLGNALGGIGRGLAGAFPAVASALSQQARDRIAAQNALQRALAERHAPQPDVKSGATSPLDLSGSAKGVKASPLARYAALLAGLR